MGLKRESPSALLRRSVLPDSRTGQAGGQLKARSSQGPPTRSKRQEKWGGKSWGSHRTSGCGLRSSCRGAYPVSRTRHQGGWCFETLPLERWPYQHHPPPQTTPDTPVRQEPEHQSRRKSIICFHCNSVSLCPFPAYDTTPLLDLRGHLGLLHGRSSPHSPSASQARISPSA